MMDGQVAEGAENAEGKTSKIMNTGRERQPWRSSVRVMVVIPAAGAGVRMGKGRAKQFLELEGKPILAMTLERFQSLPEVEGIIVVAPAGEVEFCQVEIVKKYSLNKVRKVVPGGERRQDSVRMGLEACAGEADTVLIHDGVRPLVQEGLIRRLLDAVKKDRAVITAIPIKETVKEVGEENLVVRTCDRSRLWLAQTPQAFRHEDILLAHRKAFQEGWDEMTDDALLMERMGIPVKIIMGSEENIKITTPHDLELARFLIRTRGSR